MSRAYGQIKVSLCLLCLLYLVVFRFIELCIFPVSFGFVCYYVSQVTGWEDYYALLISFVSKGFP